MIGLDCDGVILNHFGRMSLSRTRVNPDLAALLPGSDRRVAILTDQGEMALHRENPVRYPSPITVARRLVIAAEHLASLGYTVEIIGIAAYHPRADAADICAAAASVRRFLAAARFVCSRAVYTTARARKPAPFMLVQAGVAVYYGDSPEDAAAASAASVEFVLVPRFM